MSRDLRELLQESAAQPQGGFDVDDLRRRGRRVRRRRQLAVAGGSVAAVMVVMVMVVAVVAGGFRGVDQPDVMVDDSRSATPVPDVPQRTITEGTFGDGTMPWTMTAYTRNQGELCLTGPLAGTCGNDSQRPDGTFLITTGVIELEAEADKCVSGAVDPAATAIRVAYDDDGEQILRPDVHDEFGLRFFAECWTGPRNATSITALDDAGRILDSSSGLASTFKERDPEASGEWRIQGITSFGDAIVLDLDTCNATYDITVQEDTDEVRVSMTLLDLGDLDADRLDSERIELERPLGARALLLDGFPVPEEAISHNDANQ